jgi:hypothetical protein
LLSEERLLVTALQVRGIFAQRVVWSNADFDWNCARAADFRSTWDYLIDSLSLLLGLTVSKVDCGVFNAPELVRCNVDKHCLRDLAERGVNLPVTIFIERGKTTTLRKAMVVKG